MGMSSVVPSSRAGMNVTPILGKCHAHKTDDNESGERQHLPAHLCACEITVNATTTAKTIRNVVFQARFLKRPVR